MRGRRVVLLSSLAACGINPAFKPDATGDAWTTAPASTGDAGDPPPAPTTAGVTGDPTGLDASTTGGPGSATTTAVDPSTTSAGTTTHDPTTGADGDGVLCPVDPALVACYRFPKGEYATLVDDSPNGHDGTLVSVNLVDNLADHGTSAEFIVQSRATVDFDPAFNFPEYTLSAFVFVKSENRAVIDKQGQYALFVDTGQATCILRKSADAVTMVHVPIVTNEWLHLACTYDRKDLRVYVHRAGQPPIANPTSWTMGVDTTPQTAFVLGRDAPEDSAFFLGLLDHVLIYDRPLGAGELCEIAGPLCEP